MTLEPIELHEILNESSATDDNYCRMRVGKLKAILLYQSKLEDDIKILQAEKKAYTYKASEFAEIKDSLKNMCHAYERKYNDSQAMELIQRKRAIALQNQLDLYDNIKLNILG